MQTNLVVSATSSVGSTAYAYDLADRLNSITQPDTSTVGFTFDAPGRHATRTSGTGLNTTTLDSNSYIGSTDTVSVDVSSSGTGNTLKAGIDAMGDRLSTAASTGFAWIVPDLHGNVAAQCSSSGSVSDVFRYDAYGNLIGTSLPAGSVPSPWRFGGRILESTAGSDTYDFGARAYVPDLGTFTSLDSVAGSAQNPITLNRYLYANANPGTLVDPDGHCASGNANNWNFDTRSLACTPTAMTQAQNQATAEHARNKYLNGQLNADFKKSVADAKEAAAKPRDCGFLGSGCLDDPGKAVGGFSNGLNQGWQHTGGALWNSAGDMKDWAISNPTVILTAVALITVAAGCMTVGAAICLTAAAIGGASGALGYTGGVAVQNVQQHGLDPSHLMDTWDPGQMLVATAAGAGTGVACASEVGVGCLIGAATTSGAQYGSTPGDHNLGGYVSNMTAGVILAKLGGPTVDKDADGSVNWSAVPFGIAKGAGEGTAVGSLLTDFLKRLGLAK